MCKVYQHAILAHGGSRRLHRFLDDGLNVLAEVNLIGKIEGLLFHNVLYHLNERPGFMRARKLLSNNKYMVISPVELRGMNNSF
jgi:hypothetical protein